MFKNDKKRKIINMKKIIMLKVLLLTCMFNAWSQNNEELISINLIDNVIHFFPKNQKDAKNLEYL